MATLDQYFKPESDLLYRALTEENPKVEPELIEDAIIANRKGQFLQKVEVELNTLDNLVIIDGILPQIHKKYSNGYTIYGARVHKSGEVEYRVQLTVKEPKNVFELAKEDYVVRVIKAGDLDPWIHVNDLEEDKKVANWHKFMKKVEKAQVKKEAQQKRNEEVLQ